MKKFLTSLAVVFSFGMASMDVEAAKRFGGGSNIGKQRAAPTQKEATPAPASPAQAAPASPAAAPAGAAAAAAKPSFMSRWGGMLGGLAIGALLASMFGAQMGPIIGMLLMGLLVVGAIFLVMRLLANRNAAAAGATPGAAGASPANARPQFAGIGSAVPENRATAFQGNQPASASGVAPTAAPVAAAMPADFETAPFLRVAKSSFIRLQAANDAGDLDDIRDYTTPEMFAEISMQVSERGGVPQKTEVVNVEAQLIEVVTEGGYDIASVRFYGLLREAPGANPESFDETWHVRRKAGDRKDSWLISGIQQNP